MQRSSRCTAEPGPTLRRVAWTSDQQRITSCRAASGDTVHPKWSQKFNSLLKSRQSGLSFSIRAIFQTRRQRFKDGIERFKIDESVDCVFACEAGDKLGLMF